MAPRPPAQELRRTRRLTDETCHVGLQGGAQLGLDAAQRLGQRFLPARRAQTAQRPHRGRTDCRRARRLRRARFAHDPTLVERGSRERIGPPAFDAAIQPRSVAEHVQAADAEADGHACRRRGARERTQGAREQSVECRVRITLGGEPADALDDPRRLPETLKIHAHGGERLQHVEVVHAYQLAAPRVEEDELAEREELQRAAEA